MQTKSKHIKRSALVLTFLLTIHFAFSQSFSKDQLLGKIKPEQDSLFIRIDKKYTTKENIFLNKQAYQAFSQMHQAAKNEGVNLVILSATRTFNAQKSIWEKKWIRDDYKKFPPAQRVKEIMKYSSMPGTSRHHWGTDIDINSLENKYFNSQEGKKVYDWMVKNASKFGFVQTYTNKVNGRTGYEEEKWHWSYMPVAGPMLEAYLKTISYSDISGFSGSELAKETKVIEDYVNGVQ